MKLDHLRFPSGISVAQAKKHAKTISRERGLRHCAALDIVSAINGMNASWNKAVQELRQASLRRALTTQTCIVKECSPEIVARVCHYVGSWCTEGVIRTLFLDTYEWNDSRVGSVAPLDLPVHEYVGALVNADVDLWVIGPARNDIEERVADAVAHFRQRFIVFLLGNESWIRESEPTLPLRGRAAEIAIANGKLASRNLPRWEQFEKPSTRGRRS